MPKINCLLLTVALSVFSLFFFKTETNIALNTVKHTHNIKIDYSNNTFAISTNNSFLEFVGFEKQKKQNQQHYLASFKTLNKVLDKNNTCYLKTCDLINLSFTVSEKVYPFHSFL